MRMSTTTGQVNSEFKRELKNVFSGYKAMLAGKKNKKAVQKTFFSFFQKVETPQTDEPTASTSSTTPTPSPRRSATKKPSTCLTNEWSTPYIPTPRQDGQEGHTLARSCRTWFESQPNYKLSSRWFTGRAIHQGVCPPLDGPQTGYHICQHWLVNVKRSLREESGSYPRHPVCCMGGIRLKKKEVTFREWALFGSTSVCEVTRMTLAGTSGLHGSAPWPWLGPCGMRHFLATWRCGPAAGPSGGHCQHSLLLVVQELSARLR